MLISGLWYFVGFDPEDTITGNSILDIVIVFVCGVMVLLLSGLYAEWRSQVACKKYMDRWQKYWDEQIKADWFINGP